MTFDPDFGKAGFALHLFRLRYRELGLSQKAFARRYGLGYSTVRNAEQGARPMPALRVLIEAIARDPEGMALIARDAAEQCTCLDEHYGTCCASGRGASVK
jgi:hypothetical protein